MNVQQAIREQLEFWRGTLDQMVSECSAEVLHKTIPGSTTNTIAATYVHAIISEDVIVHAMLQGKASLYQSGGWEAKTGVAFPGVPPAMSPEWAGALKLNLAPFQEYAKVVYAATDAYLAGLPDAELERMTQGPAGETTVGWMVAAILGTHFPSHVGEIAALKGVHGLKGLPF